MIYPRPHPAEFAIDAPDSEIKPFSAWARGLGIAWDETNGYPEMEGLNGLFQAITQYIKYLEQNGLSEWSAEVDYPQGAGCRIGIVWYRAKVRNTNKPPATSQNEWEVFLNASALQYREPIYFENGFISVRSATQTQLGVAQFANNTEIANKSNVQKVINPSNVVQMFSRTSQQVVLPDGTIFKFGSVSLIPNGGGRDIVFDTAFPTGVFSIQVTATGSNLDDVPDYQLHTRNVSRSGFRISNSDNSKSQNAHWLAIGY